MPWQSPHWNAATILRRGAREIQPIAGKEGKRFFFVKKNQKTFMTSHRGWIGRTGPVNESFCFFFQKEALPSPTLQFNLPDARRLSDGAAMFGPWPALLIDIASLYGGVGVVVAVVFLVVGIDRVDPVARGAYAFRPLLVPGLALLWPLVLWRWRVLAGRGAG